MDCFKNRFILARSFELGPLLEDDDQINWCNLIRELSHLFDFVSLQIQELKTFSHFLKKYLKLGQLIKDGNKVTW